MIVPFNNNKINNLYEFNNIEHFASYPNCPFGKSGNCCKMMFGGVDKNNCGSSSTTQTASTPQKQTTSNIGRYPNCPFGESGNCCKMMFGGVDKNNCGSSSTPKKQTTSNIGRYPNCPFGESGNCCKMMFGGVDRNNCSSPPQNQQKVEQQPDQDDIEDEQVSIDKSGGKVTKTIRKKIGFKFIASGSGSKLFITKSATISGKIENNKISLEKLLVDGKNELPNEYINKEFLTTKNNNIISANFSPAIEVGPIKISGFTINTSSKVIDIDHNNFLNLTQFSYRKQNLYKTETIVIDSQTNSDNSLDSEYDVDSDDDVDLSKLENQLLKKQKVNKLDFQKVGALIVIFILILYLLFK